MKMPFILGSALVALALYGGLVGVNYLNFGEIDLILPTAKLIGGVWAGLAVLSLIVSWFIKESHKKTSDMPIDLDREFGNSNDDS
jgi:hypothetical protein